MIILTTFRIKCYACGVFILNIATILLGAIYIVFPQDFGLWEIAGWIFLGSWASITLLPLMVPQIVDEKTPEGKWINRMGFLTLLILGLGMLFMLVASYLLSMSIDNAFPAIGGILILLYGSFFCCTAINTLFAYTMFQQSKLALNSSTSTLKELKGSVAPNTIQPTNLANPVKLPLLRIGTIVLCAGTLGMMLYFALLAIAGFHLGVYALPSIGTLNGLMGVISAAFGWLFSILTWVVTVGLIKVFLGLRHPRVGLAIGTTGMLVGVVLLMPMVSVSLMTGDTDYRFGEAYGSDWKARIPSPVLPYFKAHPLITAECFLSHPLADCIVLEDISFYNGSTGVDTGLQLSFDAFLPPSITTGKSLPGNYSTLIRIHGGAWTIGDKGAQNMPLMDRYFAAQGYCVFDIQYGLNNQSNLLAFLRGANPAYVMGNFSINDMMRHIGLFCQFLAIHQADYHANLHSTFISGGSAGGHLTCATALAIASGNYSSIFGSGFTIKGYVPFYPANNIAQQVDGGISEIEFYNPALLVTSTSPPCLIYQGTEDGLVNPQTSQNLKDTYTQHQNSACMVIYLPFAGHGSDLDFYSYYNQFFLYYMERFVYLHR